MDTDQHPQRQRGRGMNDFLFDPDDWLGRHPALCLFLIAALVLVVDWIAPVS